MRKSKEELSRVETRGEAEVYVIPNFLSDIVCDYLIGMIDANHIRSTVVDANETGRKESDFRTSSSSFLNLSDPIVKRVNQRMHDYLPEEVDLSHGEDPQGQKYDPGQYFKDHTDFFDVNDKVSYDMHTKELGQRNWTFMIYLNDVGVGGETDFPELGLKFIPEKGKAVIWKNLLPDGRGNPKTLHAGRPPVDGSKYIITKWFREGVKTPLVQTEKFEIKVTSGEKKPFSNWEELPKLTTKGFAVVDVPEPAWGLIKDAYVLLKGHKVEENYEGMASQIYIKKDGHGTKASDVLPLWKLPTTVKLIHDFLQETHANWSQANLTPSYIYGIRSYKDGATLFAHRDRVETHHVSSIILVDEDSRTPWALDIQSHDKSWEKVYIKPGQMILYESATCEHARLDAFEGNYFRNFFVHYKLTDYEYVGA